MAYATVVSLQNTIERLLNSSDHIELVLPSPEIIQLAYKELKPLQEILKRLDSSSKSSSRKRVNAVDDQIREAVSEFENLLDFHVSDQIEKQSKSPGGERHRLLFSIDLQGLEQNIHSFTQKVTDLEEVYVKGLENLPEEEDEDDEALSSRFGFGGKKSKMVGLSDLLSKVKHYIEASWVKELRISSLVGMAGIGKTAVAREIFEDPIYLSHLVHRAWVTVGRKYQLNEIARGILAQIMDSETDKVLMDGDEKLLQHLYESLMGKRYFIVLDDVWDTQVLDNSRIFLPNNKNGSRVFLTTRLQEVAQEARPFVFNMRLLNKNESWDLLREKVFAEGSCHPQLEKAGKKIAENCDGLPLMIVTVADLLNKVEKTIEYWNNVAEKQNSVIKDAHDTILKVLFPSYEYLPQHLKPCFLYMGVFPQNYEIPRSKLINLWLAEGLLVQDIARTLGDCAKKSLRKLVSNSLIFCQTSTNWFFKSGNHIKTCRLHSSMWHLCNEEAKKNKFFHVLNNHGANDLQEGIKSQRRLCIYNNILFCMEDMCNSKEEAGPVNARSLLCFGPYHQYQVPIYLGLSLLRVLDALTIRFYKFPMEVIQLVYLRYLAITYIGKLPPSISKLWNLEFLIIHPHQSINYYGAPPYVPIQIWDMQKLKHIQIMGSNLPNPNCGSSLENLSTLLGVSAHSCTKRVLKRISNLKKLGIQIELVPDDDSKLFRCLNRIFRLRSLESFKCVLVNTELRSKLVSPPTPLSMFPYSLRKLHLSGLGYPWEYMSIIAKVKNLEVLKLRSYAFQGPKWVTKDEEFQRLKFLTIEDTDLERWEGSAESFHWLTHLSIKHCYKLKELCWKYHSRYGYSLEEIEVVDCNPSALYWINQIKWKRGNPHLEVCV